MNTSLIIIPEDGAIGIDGQFLLEIDPQYLSWIPENVHAFHWYVDRNQGEIEFKSHPFDPTPPNERVNELGVFEQAITTYNEEVIRRAQEEADRIAEIEDSIDYWEELRVLRNIKLSESDWTQLSDAPLTEEEVQLWKIYRQELRDLPENIEDPKPPVNDPNHPSWPVPPN
jgi:hypothetical protein